jgi:hypothetical protein
MVEALRRDDRCAQDYLIAVFWLVANSMRSTGDLAAARRSDPPFSKPASRWRRVSLYQLPSPPFRCAGGLLKC